MIKNYFQVVRAGINTTFQDQGRKNLYHIGIPFSGAMDNRNYLLENQLVGNKSDLQVLDFAYQGLWLKYFGNKITIAIMGDVNFTIKNMNELMEIVMKMFRQKKVMKQRELRQIGMIRGNQHSVEKLI